MNTAIGMASAAGEERLVYSVAEAGALRGISRAFAYELVARGGLPVIRLVRRRLVPKAALRALISLEHSTLTVSEGYWSNLCGRPQKCPHPRSRLREVACLHHSALGSQSSQGRRSRGARRVGRRTLTALSCADGHNGIGRPSGPA
jgi:excisionase family DNA binding protein